MSKFKEVSEKLLAKKLELKNLMEMSKDYYMEHKTPPSTVKFAHQTYMHLVDTKLENYIKAAEIMREALTEFDATDALARAEELL